MGPPSSPRGTVAYFEDVDSNEEPVEDSRQYARSIYNASPTKERPSPNTSKALFRNTPSDESDFALEPSPSPPRKPSKMKKSGKSKHIVVDDGRKPPKRPGARSSKTTQAIPHRMHDEASYYGIPTERETVVNSNRPRPRPRSETFSGPNQVARSSRGPPPPFPMGPPGFPGPGPPGYGGPPMGPPPGGYPPPWAQPGHGPPPMGGPPPHGRHPLPPPSMAPGGPPEYMRGPVLSKRFERPQSAMGVRQPSGYDESPHALERLPGRRQSVSRKASKDHDDRFRMPPPPMPMQRPASARPSGGERLAFRPPPPTLGIRESRKKPSRQQEEYDDDQSVFYDSISQHRASGDFGAYDVDSDNEYESYRMVPAQTPQSRRSRRQSQPMYELAEKMRRASIYQDDVDRSGGAPLTANALKQVGNGGSSRSTRSSASRDESDYRHSATTRTTRSGNVEDDITIKVPRGAVVEMGGAKMTFREGGDMSFGRGKNGNNNNGNGRDGSDHDDEYSDEEYERNERSSRRDRLLTHRSRAPSQGTAYQQYPRALPYSAGAYGSSPFSHQQYAPPAGAFSYDHYDDDDYYGSYH